MSRYLCILRRNQFQLLRLAENLRELTVLSDGTARLQQEAVDLDRLCGELAESVQALVPEITIDYRAPSVPCVTLCDAERIEHLLLNLLSNSLLHCLPGQAVRILLQRSEDTIQVVVSDNGSGIPREKMGTLFSDYTRRPDFAETGRGSGFGLSVAEQIARAHGGSLVITSEEGHGTKAVFSIPRVSCGELRAPRETRGNRMLGLLIGLSDAVKADKFQKPYL
jgi:two-component system sensor histidine kinase VicK